jgi:hypothetical protein
MKLLHRCAVITLLALLAASNVLADVARPDNKRPRREEAIRSDLPSARMTIESVRDLSEARLQVPRSLLGQLNAAGAYGPQGADAGSQSGAFKAPGTIIAGLFLSLSVALAGLLLLRSRRRVPGRVAAAALVCAVMAGTAAVVSYANAGLPPPRPADPGTLRKAVSGKSSLAGSVRVEVVEEGSEIKLLVPAKSQGDDEE